MLWPNLAESGSSLPRIGRIWPISALLVESGPNLADAGRVGRDGTTAEDRRTNERTSDEEVKAASSPGVLQQRTGIESAASRHGPRTRRHSDRGDCTLGVRSTATVPPSALPRILPCPRRDAGPRRQPVAARQPHHHGPRCNSRERCHVRPFPGGCKRRRVQAPLPDGIRIFALREGAGENVHRPLSTGRRRSKFRQVICSVVMSQAPDLGADVCRARSLQNWSSPPEIGHPPSRTSSPRIGRTRPESAGFARTRRNSLQNRPRSPQIGANHGNEGRCLPQVCPIRQKLPGINRKWTEVDKHCFKIGQCRSKVAGIPRPTRSGADVDR